MRAALAGSLAPPDHRIAPDRAPVALVSASMLPLPVYIWTYYRVNKSTCSQTSRYRNDSLFFGGRGRLGGVRAPRNQGGSVGGLGCGRPPDKVVGLGAAAPQELLPRW